MNTEDQSADPQGTAGQVAGSGDDKRQETAAQPEGSTKMFTQAELNAILDSRIAKAVKSAKSEAMKEADEKAKREKMDEAERLKADVTDREQKIADLEARMRQSRIREQLAGKVVNLDDAVAVMDDTFVDEDGKVNVEGFLESRPYFRVQQQKAGTTANPGNPPGTKRLTREQIAQMSEKEIEDRWEEVQAALS